MSFSVDQLKGLSPGYARVLDAGLVGFSAFTQLQPWYFLPDGEIFSVAEQWPSSSENSRELIAFAVRQDCDDIACFEMLDGRISKLAVIEGWSEGSYNLVAGFESFEEWFEAARNQLI